MLNTEGRRPDANREKEKNTLSRPRKEQITGTQLATSPINPICLS